MNMGEENARQFDEWYARNHPFDWFTKELGVSVPMQVRLKVWSLCRAAWFHTESDINAQPQSEAPVTK
jgi:hypothetical protein